jgi:hypothetical protein
MIQNNSKKKAQTVLPGRDALYYQPKIRIYNVLLVLYMFAPLDLPANL